MPLIVRISTANNGKLDEVWVIDIDMTIVHFDHFQLHKHNSQFAFIMQIVTFEGYAFETLGLFDSHSVNNSVFFRQQRPVGIQIDQDQNELLNDPIYAKVENDIFVYLTSEISETPFRKIFVSKIEEFNIQAILEIKFDNSNDDIKFDFATINATEIFMLVGKSNNLYLLRINLNSSTISSAILIDNEIDMIFNIRIRNDQINNVAYFTFNKMSIFGDLTNQI